MAWVARESSTFNLDVIIEMNMHELMEIRLVLGKGFHFSKTEVN